jgi:lysophospholipase
MDAKAALTLLLLSTLPAWALSAVSEDSFSQMYASSIAPYIRDNAAAGEVRMDDGAMLRYESIRNPNEKGVVVLLGAHSESYVTYAELLYDLRDLGVTFYALDLRGQGFSSRMLPDREKDYIPAYDRYLADLKSFMKSVVHIRQGEKVALLGHSLGGAVAAAYAERNPDDINGLVLSSPYLGSRSGALALLMLKALDILGRGKEYVPGGGPFKPVAFEQNVETHSRVRHARKMQDYEDHPEARLGYPTNHWIAETERMGKDVVQNASLISCPTLVLQAEDDRYADGSAQDKFCAGIPHSKKILFLGSYGEILLESDSIRDFALAAIRNFIQRNF